MAWGLVTPSILKQKICGGAAALAASLYASIAVAQSGLGISPMDPPYSCFGDGVHDDTNCFQAALTASQGQQLILGPHRYLLTKPLVITAPVHIRGVGSGWQTDSSSCLIVGVPNLPSLITVPWAAGGSTFRGFCIQPAPGVVNTAGVTITLNRDTSSVKIENLWIASPCIGVDLNGNSNSIGGSLTFISNVSGRGCVGIRVGVQSLYSGTVDPRIENTSIQGNINNPPDEDLLLLDAGGLYLAHDDFLYGVIGTKIFPGVNQQVIWGYALDTALGDTTVRQGLYVDTNAPSAQVKGLNFSMTWTASSSVGDEVYIGNEAGGKVADLSFLHHRSLIGTSNTSGSGFAIDANVTNISINASEICGYSGYGVSLLNNAGSFMLSGSRVQPNCALLNGRGRYAINFAGGNSGILVNGNDFTNNFGSYAGINGAPSNNAVITSNLPGDTAAPTVDAAASITLPSISSHVYIRGAATVRTIAGGYTGRTVQLITINGPVAFASGGNLCNAKTTTGAFDSVIAWYNGACWTLK